MKNFLLELPPNLNMQQLPSPSWRRAFLTENKATEFRAIVESSVCTCLGQLQGPTVTIVISRTVSVSEILSYLNGLDPRNMHVPAFQVPYNIGKTYDCTHKQKTVCPGCCDQKDRFL